MYVVSLAGYRPSPRFDGIPWTSVVIEEAPASSGPWSVIETKALVPDDNPERPQQRDITTELATLPAGWYRLIFVDATGDRDQPTDPVFAGAAITYRPSVSDVAQHLIARTVDSNGVRQGTFTEDTRPTGLEVERVISTATRNVAQIVGLEVPAETTDMVRDAIALRAAAMVERSYFPEQLRTDRSLYDALREEYDNIITSVTEAVMEAESGGKVGGVDEARFPSAGFPEDVGGMVGWGTRW